MNAEDAKGTQRRREDEEEGMGRKDKRRFLYAEGAEVAEDAEKVKKEGGEDMACRLSKTVKPWHPGDLCDACFAEDAPQVEARHRATVHVSTSSFAGTITSGENYSPHIYGMIKAIRIIENADSGGTDFTYNCWMPLGRGVNLDAAIQAAETLGEEIFGPPSLIIEEGDDCRALYDMWSQTNYNNYADEIDGSSGVGSAVAGASALGTAGGSVGFLFGGPFGAAVGGIVGSITGGVGGLIHGVTTSVDDVKREYRKRYRNLWTCYQACLLTGDWDCGAP